MSRKQREITQEQYTKIAYLARRLIPQRIIAREVGYTPEAFTRRKGRDPELQKAIQGGYDQGKIALYVAQYRAAIDHYLTICRDCHKIYEGEFLESCYYCDKEDPAEKGNHTNVRHKFIQADTTMLIHLGKHHLGQTEKSLLEVRGDPNSPVIYRNLSEEQIDKKLAALLPFLNEQYGYKKAKEEEPESGNNVMPVADYT